MRQRGSMTGTGHATWVLADGVLLRHRLTQGMSREQPREVVGGGEGVVFDQKGLDLLSGVRALRRRFRLLTQGLVNHTNIGDFSSKSMR